MTRFRIATVGPCCRCDRFASHILIVDGRRVVVHEDVKVTPCPVQPGEMLELGDPVEVRP